MEIIYRTFDGKEFNNEADAAYHENSIRDDLAMWDGVGRIVDEPSKAFMVYFATPEARKCFKFLADKEDCIAEFAASNVGLYYWDECDEIYRPVDMSMAKTLVKVMTWIDEMKARKEREAQ